MIETLGIVQILVLRNMKMNELEILVNALIKEKVVCFSFESSKGTDFVKVRECEDYDFVEYDEEYKEGEMFEIGSLKSFESYIKTSLQFKDIYEAGNSVLKLRAETIGLTWESV